MGINFNKEQILDAKTLLKFRHLLEKIILESNCSMQSIMSLSKEEVVAILGEPKLTSFDAYGDKWEYIKTSNFITGEAKYITVLFDRSGKVVQYDTKITEANNSKDCHQRPVPPYGDGSFPDAPANFVCCIDDAGR